MLAITLASRLRLKKELLEHSNNKHKEIKTGLIVDGGFMKGRFAAGAIATLQNSSTEGALTSGLDAIYKLGSFKKY